MRPLEDASKNGWTGGRFQRHDGSKRPMATEDQEHILIVRSAIIAFDSSLSTIRCTTRTRLVKHFLGKPYLSPIEHDWDMMGRRLHLPGKANVLAQQLKQSWREISQETIRMLYHSMVRRMAACIQTRVWSRH
ncbi:hypothetical protein TNCV_2736921 [Trichonephila clavipes]|nr:hypothetical protein TNCV_2736921 [Trichonephila clavipes]